LDFEETTYPVEKIKLAQISFQPIRTEIGVGQAIR